MMDRFHLQLTKANQAIFIEITYSKLKTVAVDCIIIPLAPELPQLFCTTFLVIYYNTIILLLSHNIIMTIDSY